MGEEEQGRKYSPAPATWWLATAGGAAELGKLVVVDLGEEQNWVEEQSSRGAEPWGGSELGEKQSSR
jgi:hypothetical protein